MTTQEALMRLRSGYIDGEHRMGEIYFHTEALMEICDGDRALIGDTLKALDNASPGGVFGFFLGGGRVVDRLGGVEFVYQYDTKPAAIAAVMGRAIMASRNRETT